MKTIKQSIALAILMSCMPLSHGLLAAANQLQGISAQASGGNKTEVRLQFNTPVNLPKGSFMDNPPRLVFDFPATDISAESHQKNINLGKVQSVDAANDKGQARVVIRLQERINHTVETQGNTVVVTFETNEVGNKHMSRSGKATVDLPPPPTGNTTPNAEIPVKSLVSGSDKVAPITDVKATTVKTSGKVADKNAVSLPEVPVPTSLNPEYAWYTPPGNAAPQPTPPAPEPIQASMPPVSLPPPEPVPTRMVANPPPANASVLQGVDFRREPDGSGRVIITLPSASTKVSEEKRGNTINVSINDVDTPAQLQKRMDVLDFGTPVSSIDVAQRDLGSRVMVSTNENFDYRVQRNGSEYILFVDKLKVPPEEKLLAEQKQKKTFSGEKLSLNFQDIEVRAVLQLLADFTNKNIVVSDSVQGNITVRLKDVPWDQALDIVLESKNLAMRENGNVIWVAPAAELDAKEKQQLEAIKAKQDLEPLVTEYIPVNFAKATDLAALIQKSQGESKQSLLSPRGKVSVDERTNTLLVQDTATQVKAVRDLVKALDIPVEQVLIESRIVIANDSFGKDLGARFGVTPKWANGDSIGMGTGHLGTGVDEYWSSVTKAMSDPTGKTDIKIPSLTDRLSVNLPVAGAAGSFGFTILSSDFMIDLELSALQAESKGEIISTPRVITSNQTKATIQQGVEIPYQQASSSGATNVAFKKAVLSLEVTPQITPDEHVSMDLKVNQDTVGEIYAGVPSINTREVQTKVLVENGQTVVLGGVHETENINGSSKVPVLGDLPVVGSLFRNTTNQDKKRELLIFVTPKIVNGKS